MTVTQQTSAIHDIAVDAVLWGVPIVSFDAMRRAFLHDVGARYGDVAYLSRFADWQLRLTTPNASTRYVLSFCNTREGPVIIDIPAAEGAGLFGSILDAWQVPLVDVGPAGTDAGKGGQYLLIPPDYTGKVPSDIIPIACTTFNTYAAFRAISEGSSEDAVQRALQLVKQIRIYPLSRSREAASRTIDIAGQLFDGIVRFDDSYFSSLATMIDEEPALLRDEAMLEHIKELGIEKGRPFAPTHDLRRELNSSALEALTHLIRQEPREGTEFWPGLKWRTANPVGPRTGFSYVSDGTLDVQARAQMYFMACAPPKVLGKASMYLMAFVDRDGQQLDGDHEYRLHVPAKVPAKQFWALTVYDLETCAFLVSSPKVEVNSYQEGLVTNPDGSTDLHLSVKTRGPKANWVALCPGRKWFAILRFYGPTSALSDKSWQATDFARVD